MKTSSYTQFDQVSPAKFSRKMMIMVTAITTAVFYSAVLYLSDFASCILIPHYCVCTKLHSQQIYH